MGWWNAVFGIFRRQPFREGVVYEGALVYHGFGVAITIATYILSP